MVFSFSLSASSLVTAHVRQNVSLVFITREKIAYSFSQIKKWIYSIVTVLSFCIFLPSSGYATSVGETQQFIVTAYYSPLPDQSFYLRWNYTAEKKLNGNGTNGASGVPVFTGMIAAPKWYNFGTKIYFEWLGIWEVEDRGGAIITVGGWWQTYDRIDIWMGQGEAWLKRALIWWRRKVTGTVVESSASGKYLNLSGIDSGEIDISKYEKVTSNLIGTLPLEILSQFADLGYMSEGKPVKEMISSFQLDHSIISKSSDPGAGNYGPLTQGKLREEYGRYTLLKEAEIHRIESERALLISAHADWESRVSQAEAKVNTFGHPARWEKGDHIRELQAFLRSSGYFRGKDSGTMTPATILALKSLQRKNGLSPTGEIDIQTRITLVETLIEKQLV